MFTPGFKFFFGLAVLGLVGAFVYGISSGDVTGPDYFGFVDRRAIVGLLSLGWKGSVGGGMGFFVLIFLSGTAAFIGCTAVAFRDADVESVAELDGSSTMPIGQRPTTPSWWPLAAAAGMGVLIIGLVLDTKAFWIIGLVVLAVVAMEWALTAWSERATASTKTNSVIRDRVLAPFEIPILGVAGLAVIALSVSRILLAASVYGAVAIAGVVALVIFLIAVLFAMRPQMSRRTMGAVVGAFAVVLVGLGVLFAALGPRDIEHHGSDHEDHSEETTVSDE